MGRRTLPSKRPRRARRARDSEEPTLEVSLPEATPTREIEVSTALLDRLATGEITEQRGPSADEATEPRGISAAMAVVERARSEPSRFESDFPTLRPPATRTDTKRERR